MRALIEALDRLEKVIKRDHDLTVRALGLLLLRKKFDRPEKEKDVDLTTLVLESRGPVIPEL